MKIVVLGLAAVAAAVSLPASNPTGALAGGNAVLYAKSLTSLEDSAGGKDIASIMPSTPLVAKAHKDGYVEVEIKGWSPAGGDRYLFKDVGVRIKQAVLTDDGLKNRRAGETKEDDWGSEWTDATISGWIPEKDTTSDLDGLWKEAGDIYFSHCTRCHSLRRPREFTADQWPQALKVMTVRAGLTQEQAALVTALLQDHAKDQNVSDAFTEEAASKPTTAPAVAAKVEGTPALAAKGAELFKSGNCFACHGEDAKSPVLPGYPKLAGQNAEYIDKQIMDFKAGKRTNDADNAMKDAVAPLTEDEAKAIAYWLSTR